MMQCVMTGEYALARDGKPIAHDSLWRRGYDGAMVRACLFEMKDGTRRVLLRPAEGRGKAYWVSAIQFNNGNRSYLGPVESTPSTRTDK